MSVLDMQNEPGEIRTHSAVRAWWFIKIKDYHLKVKVRSNPEPTALGRIRYKNTWVLKPAVRDTDPQTRQARHRQKEQVRPDAVNCPTPEDENRAVPDTGQL